MVTLAFLTVHFRDVVSDRQTDEVQWCADRPPTISQRERIPTILRSCENQYTCSL